MSELKNKSNINNWDTLLFSNKVLLYENNSFQVATNKVIGVKGGVIVFIEDKNNFLKHTPLTNIEQAMTFDKAIASKEQKKVYRFNHHILCPGFVNTHTHVPMSLFRGVADDLPFKTWLEDYILPLEKEFVTEEFVTLGVYLSALELIKSGVTTICDMYFYNEALAKAVDKAGLRGVIGVGIPSGEKTKPHKPTSTVPYWQSVINNLRRKHQGQSRIRVALAPHSPYALSKKELEEIGQFAKQENIFLTIHVSESLWEQQEIKKLYNKTPIEYLHSLNITGPNSLFVHCVHANTKDLQIMHDTGTGFSYNPESNMKLFTGIAPVTGAWKMGVSVGLGTDGPASNNNQNFFGEMDCGLKLQKLKEGDNSIGAFDMLQIATITGAKALNWDEQCGSITVGKQADILAIDLKHPSLYPGYNVVSDLVYSASGEEVEFVMCNGKVLMEQRKIKTLDEDKIYEQVNTMSEKIKHFLKK